ncbi:5-methyltetrahydropteroyltriglutamate--homocyst ei nemethyltransferase, putative [Leishmania tarentolae]|uniref:5-methyltetrahydropteroyltriglutamate--homocysteine S-methyltransferase n=1 Tax=Leishmania tarentolae TaxID=5689 RepID=A0A640KU28_LEITA|nr:5-methyltetrahydropteroyltriglutamate--homocyst ei nemethyltransferase, putative [Leishmania tarentolae]
MPSLVPTHTLGFPRVGEQRELKKALESYWRGDMTEAALRQVGSDLRKRHLKEQNERGVSLLPVGDFAWYDHVLTTSLMLGNVPARHRAREDAAVDMDTLFRVARGRAPTGTPAAAAEMTKWFNTNYHYIVPEFTSASAEFHLCWPQLFEELEEAKELFGAERLKAVLLGPVTYVYLGKVKGEEAFDRTCLLPKLVPVYAEILKRVAALGVKWVQIDEPALVLELDSSWGSAYQDTYSRLRSAIGTDVKLLLTTYFESVSHHLPLIASLPVNGLHIDLSLQTQSALEVERVLPKGWVLSAGLVNGRNVWRTDLLDAYQLLASLRKQSPGRTLWIGTSCSLLHSPINLECETELEPVVKEWLSFALQKCSELQLLADALATENEAAVAAYTAPLRARQHTEGVVRETVRDRVAGLTAADACRLDPFPQRWVVQQEKLKLPLWPTTTIGSFPQTSEVRAQRLAYKKARVDKQTYESQLREHIAYALKQQEDIGLDVLVHGEAERNDMVEYFGEQLEGFAFTQNGWVQSYGSRCVKPPIIVGDISRPHPMTVSWAAYAQSLTQRPVKGMLTGPVTILCWSFVREDLSRQSVTEQLALAIRDEVCDLERAGIKVIQVDEPGLREGLPLQRSKWEQYLDWASRAFRVSTSGVAPQTQIHTHMCYAEVNDVIKTIASMDADVISIEASRSDMEPLTSFADFTYPNAVGPGVYDIHSPNIPTTQSIVDLLLKATQYLPVRQLWVNPDCGLKTRTWDECRAALQNMVTAATELRRIKPQ